MTRTEYLRQKAKERILSQALSEFRLSASKLSQALYDFDNDVIGIENYPFDYSFQEVVSDIIGWTFTTEMEVFKTALTEKAITEEDEQ